MTLPVLQSAFRRVDTALHPPEGQQGIPRTRSAGGQFLWGKHTLVESLRIPGEGGVTVLHVAVCGVFA